MGNIVNFPENEQKEEEKTKREKFAEEAQAMLDKIDSHINEGMTAVVDNTNGVAEADESSVVKTVQGLSKALAACLELIDVIRTDLISTIENVNAQGSSMLSQGAYLQALYNSLVVKGVITQEEVNEQYTEVVKGELDKISSDQNQTSEEAGSDETSH